MNQNHTCFIDDEEEHVKYNYEVPSCSICLNEMMCDLSVTSCGHVFHKECIRIGLRKRQICPNCRSFTELGNLRELNYEICRTEINDNEQFKFLNELDVSSNHMDMIKNVQSKNAKIFEQNQELQKKCNFAIAKEEIALNEQDQWRKVIEKLKEKREKDLMLAQEQSDTIRIIQENNEELKKRHAEMGEKRDELLNEVIDLQKYKGIYDNTISDKEIENYTYIKTTFSLEQQTSIFYEGILSLKSKLYKTNKELELQEDKLNLTLKRMAKLEDSDKSIHEELNKFKSSTNKLTFENARLKDKIQKMKEKASLNSEDNGISNTEKINEDTGINKIDKIYEDTDSLIIEQVPRKKKLLKQNEKRNSGSCSLEKDDNHNNKKDLIFKPKSKNPFIPSDLMYKSIENGTKKQNEEEELNIITGSLNKMNMETEKNTLESIKDQNKSVDFNKKKSNFHLAEKLFGKTGDQDISKDNNIGNTKNLFSGPGIKSNSQLSNGFKSGIGGVKPNNSLLFKKKDPSTNARQSRMLDYLKKN